MPKIAFLLGSINRGGLETLMLDVFRHAYSKGLSAMCIYRKDGTLKEEYEKTGIKIKKIAFSKNIFKYLRKLRREIIENDIKIAHAQQLIDAFYALLALKGTKVRVVLTLHGYDLSLSKFSYYLTRFVLNHTDLNIFVSNEQKKYYIEKYNIKKNNQEVTYNGISFQKFNPDHNSDIRKEFGFPKNVLLLAAVGNFVAVRDQITLCRFLNLLDKELQIDFRFLFIGLDVDKKQYDECVSYIKQHKLDNKVIFTGGRSDVPDVLYQLDAFLYSTNHDTFGISVIEAMYTETPVFVNDWGVMLEVTKNGQYATIYKTKDEYDLLFQFKAFLQDKQPYLQKAKDASDYVITNYSIDNYIERLEINYKKLEKTK